MPSQTPDILQQVMERDPTLALILQSAPEGSLGAKALVPWEASPSLWSQLAALGTALGMALPGRGGLTNPTGSAETAALIGKFAARFPKVFRTLEKRHPEPIPVKYPSEAPPTMKDLFEEGLPPLGTLSKEGVTVRSGGRPVSAPSNTLLHEVLHKFYEGTGGYPRRARQIAEGLGKPLTKREEEALKTENIEMLLQRLSGLAARDPYGEAAIEKMVKNIARRSPGLRFP